MKNMTNIFMVLLCTLTMVAGSTTVAGPQTKEGGAPGNVLLPPDNPVSMRSATGADLVIGTGTYLTLTGGVYIQFGGNFSNSGVLSAATPSTVGFTGYGPQVITGETTFDNLTKTGSGKLTLASPITVNNALLVLDDTLETGSNTITFGTNGTLNGTFRGGEIIGPDTVIGPGFSSMLSTMHGWNLLSLPVLTHDCRRTTLFPTAVSSAFIYENSYKPSATVSNGVGFWLKFSGTQNHRCAGSSYSQTTIDVKSGWNLIGSLSSPLPVSKIVPVGTSIISRMYDYRGSYSPSDTIFPGRGYWVKTSNAGRLILDNSATTVSAAKLETEHAVPGTFNELTIGRLPTLNDANGVKQTLFFGKTSGKEIALENFEMPPIPPKGSFDARFGSNRFVALVPDIVKEWQEIPLLIQSDEQPLELSWIVKEEPAAKYVFAERRGGEVVSRQLLRETGTMVITVKDGSDYVIRMEQLPLCYVLYQNYPNPFNPSTVIHYSLPLGGHSTLKVYDLLGREVVTLVDADEEAGHKSVEWDASSVASGVYYYRLQAASANAPDKTFTEVKKMLLVR